MPFSPEKDFLKVTSQYMLVSPLGLPIPSRITQCPFDSQVLSMVHKVLYHPTQLLLWPHLPLAHSTFVLQTNQVLSLRRMALVVACDRTFFPRHLYSSFLASFKLVLGTFTVSAKPTLTKHLTTAFLPRPKFSTLSHVFFWFYGMYFTVLYSFILFIKFIVYFLSPTTM